MSSKTIPLQKRCTVPPSCSISVKRQLRLNLQQVKMTRQFGASHRTLLGTSRRSRLLWQTLPTKIVSQSRRRSQWHQGSRPMGLSCRKQEQWPILHRLLPSAQASQTTRQLRSQKRPRMSVAQKIMRSFSSTYLISRNWIMTSRSIKISRSQAQVSTKLNW